MECKQNKIHQFVEDVVHTTFKLKQIPGDVFIIVNIEQGMLNIQRCLIVSLYWRYNKQTIILERVRSCILNNESDDLLINNAFTEILVKLLSSDDVWNLINTKLQ